MKKIKHLAADSMIFIYLLENHAQWVPSIKRYFEQSERITLSSLGLAEIVTGFEKAHDEEGKLKFLSFIESYEKISVIGFGENEALMFARLRAEYAWLKPPDAIHLATALTGRADGFLTNDHPLKRIKEIQILTC